MDFLNYHHLRYFWIVAREGSIRRAAERLSLSQPTISAQIRELEDALGESLFDRKGRSLVLTDVGEAVRRYADDIFLLGDDLLSAVRHLHTDRPKLVYIGVCQWLPKLLVSELVRPIFDRKETLTVRFIQGDWEPLLGKLAVHQLDLVLSDAPASGLSATKAFNHYLGKSEIVFCVAKKEAKRLSKNFPSQLDTYPALMPPQASQLRGHVDRWLIAHGIRPQIIADFEDSALMKDVAALGYGWLPIHSSVVKDVCHRYGLAPIGTAKGCEDQFYAITIERKMRSESALAILKGAQRLENSANSK